jgi:hypothetical protein
MDINTQVLLALGDIKQQLGGLSAKVDEVTKLAPRVTTLEHDRTRLRGMIIAISALASVFVTVGTAVAKRVFT